MVQLKDWKRRADVLIAYRSFLLLFWIHWNKSILEGGNELEKGPEIGGHSRPHREEA